MYAIFIADTEKKGKVDEILKDDVVSRQSITVRDAEALGLEEKGLLILIEGTEEALKRSEELFKDVAKKIPEEEAKEIFSKFKAQEEDVAGSIGFIFG